MVFATGARRILFVAIFLSVFGYGTYRLLTPPISTGSEPLPVSVIFDGFPNCSCPDGFVFTPSTAELNAPGCRCPGNETVHVMATHTNLHYVSQFLDLPPGAEFSCGMRDVDMTIFSAIGAEPWNYFPGEKTEL